MMIRVLNSLYCIPIQPNEKNPNQTKKNTYNNVVQLGNQTKERIIGQVLQGEFTLSSVTGISLTQYSMTVTGNNLTTVEGIPKVLLDIFFRGINTNGILQLQGPTENFLVGQTVEGTSQTVQTGGEREIRIREGRTNQMSTVYK